MAVTDAWGALFRLKYMLLLVATWTDEADMFAPFIRDARRTHQE